MVSDIDQGERNKVRNIVDTIIEVIANTNKNADIFIQNKFAKTTWSVEGVQIRIAWKDIL